MILHSNIYGIAHKDLVLAAFVSDMFNKDEINMADWVKYKDLLTEEQYKAFEPYFIYFDNSKGEKVPALIDISKSEKLKAAYDEDAAETLTIGVVLEGPNPEMVGKYIEYLLK